MRYTATELEVLPTLCVSQADDLKIEKPGLRVWLCRCTVDDGAPVDDMVSIEELIDDRWVVTSTYGG